MVAIWACLLMFFFNPQKLYASCVALGGDERLQNLCLLHQIDGALIDRNTALYIDQRLKSTGMTSGLKLPDGGSVGAEGANLSLTPVLQYFANINGGNPREILHVGSISLKGEREFLKKDDLSAGARVTFNLRELYGEGSYFNYLGTAALSQGLSVPDKVAENAHSICSMNKISKTMYFDFCASAAKIKKTLSKNETKDISLIFSMMENTKWNKQIHYKLGLAELFEEQYEQTSTSIGVDVISDAKVFYSANFRFGEPVNDELVTTHALGASLGFFIYEKPIRLSANIKKASGGLFLGVARQTNTKNISISFPISDYFYLSVGYEEVDAKINFFDQASPSIAINFTSYTF